MRKTVIIPTYWSRKGNAWKPGDIVYDHPTPIDQKGTLGRTLVSMRCLLVKDFKLVILVCATTPEIEKAAKANVVQIVEESRLNAETYLFDAASLRGMKEILTGAGIPEAAGKLLSLSGYSNVRNMCLLAASVLTSDATILIDDDEVIELPDFVPRAVEFLGTRVYGDTVHGIAGYYLNKENRYYDDVRMEAWMTYWNRFEMKSRAFDKIIGTGPRLKRTPFVFGGAMVLSRELFECVPFDPRVPRGEDVDYLINSRMYGFSFFLDNTLSVKHLPEPKSHPEWQRMREDICRFVYQREKIRSQYETGSNVLVYPEDLDPYPGEFLKEDLEEKIFKSSVMLSLQYLADDDREGCRQSLKNISISRHEAIPKEDAFSEYVKTQENWDLLIRLAKANRYALRAVMERDNLTAPQIILGHAHERTLSEDEVKNELKKLTINEGMTDWDLTILSQSCYIKTFYEQEYVFLKGDYNDAVSIILRGKIGLLSDDAEAAEASSAEIACLGPGDLLGETCLVHETFHLTGIAREFTELICIRKSRLNELINDQPTLGVKLLKIFLAGLSDKMTSSNQILQALSANDPWNRQYSADEM